jgi:hypothetical protein
MRGRNDGFAHTYCMNPSAAGIDYLLRKVMA